MNRSSVRADFNDVLLVECPQAQLEPPYMPPEVALSFENEEQEQTVQLPLPASTGVAGTSTAIVLSELRDVAILGLDNLREAIN